MRSTFRIANDNEQELSHGMPGLMRIVESNVIKLPQQQPGSAHPEVAGRRFSRLAVTNQFEADFLTFSQFAQARTLHSADMYENVGCSIVRLDKTISLGGIEPLHSTCAHIVPL